MRWLAAASRDDQSASFAATKHRAETAERHFEAAVRTLTLTETVIREKMRRISSANPERPVACVKALDHETQLNVLVQTLHEDVARRLSPGRHMRLGVYLRDEDADFLKPILSWDGTKSRVFSDASRNHMRLSSPGGKQARTMVVQCWFSEEPLLIVPDGMKAGIDGASWYFYSGQEKHLRSMVAYRHVFENDPEAQALILTLDTDEPDFFTEMLRPDLETTLRAFAVRLEFELVSLIVSSSEADKSPS